MAKRLEREFGRYDVDALDSDEYLGMPAAVRTDAYFYLLMLSGRSRKRRTDGVLSRQVADDIARRMKCSGVKLLTALAGVAMVTFDDSEVVVLKYAKWQQTRAEIEEVKAERSAAGRSGGIASGNVRRSKGEANGEALGSQVSKQNEAEKEIEEEEETLLAPLVPYAPPVPVMLNDDPSTKLALWWHEFIGRQISEHDRQAAAAFIFDYPRLGLNGIELRIKEHAGWRVENNLKPLGKLEFYRDTLRDQETHLADEGVPRPRDTAGAFAGLLKDLQ